MFLINRFRFFLFRSSLFWPFSHQENIYDIQREASNAMERILNEPFLLVLSPFAFAKKNWQKLFQNVDSFEQRQPGHLGCSNLPPPARYEISQAFKTGIQLVPLCFYNAYFCFPFCWCSAFMLRLLQVEKFFDRLNDRSTFFFKLGGLFGDFFIYLYFLFNHNSVWLNSKVWLEELPAYGHWSSKDRGIVPASNVKIKER